MTTTLCLFVSWTCLAPSIFAADNVVMMFQPVGPLVKARDIEPQKDLAGVEC